MGDYHSWYDDPEWPYWKDLYEAEIYIEKYVRKWSRCNLISKEKYGTIRYEWMFPPGTSVRLGWGFTIPYFKKAICNGQVEIPRFRWYWGQSWIVRKWTNFGWYVCIKAVDKACLKWPHIAEEIRSDLDWRLE